MITQIYTDENGKQIEVVFDELQYQVIDKVDHSIYYECRGMDKDGNEYSGSAEYCCDELQQIEEIYPL